jgi:hypothetical protein
VLELAGQPLQMLHQIYAIDFNGPKDAGNKIWIAKGIAKDECTNV